MRKVKIKIKDPSKYICENLIGENHTKTHHMIAGGMIAIFGVGIVKVSMWVPFEPVHFAGELIGYVIHGIGSIPFVDHIVKEMNAVRKEDKKEEKEKQET